MPPPPQLETNRDYDPATYPQQSTYDFPAIDFLDVNGAQSANIDMGFGLGGWDFSGEHDWSEGNNLDLFDGFFFGGGGGA